MSRSSQLVERPAGVAYRMLASVYDDVIGRNFFRWVRRVFAGLVRRHRIAFDSAADLGCGTGLFARHLSRAWKVPVFGVDLSPAMLRVAAANCRGAPVALLHQDIRRLRLPHPVDLVTANFDTVNHLLNPLDLQSLFRRVHASLTAGGHFIFDFIPPCGSRESVSVVEIRAARGGRRITQRIRWTPLNRLLSYRITLRGPTRGSDCVELHTERTYEPRDVARWLFEAGFIVREVLDAKTLRGPLSCPRRVIVVAQKRL